MKPDHYDPIAAALKEDIGDGDITTDSFVPETLHATGRIIAREKAVVDRFAEIDLRPAELGNLFARVIE